MAYTQAQKNAFNSRCKKNYQEYNRRISDLEEKAQNKIEPFKLIGDIKKCQKELAAKNDKGKPVVELFGKGKGSTRDVFFNRLNSLFSNANKKNKAEIENRIDQLDKKMSTGNVRAEELKKLNPLLYAVPVKERQYFKQKVDGLFSRLKSQGKDPELEIHLGHLNDKLKNVDQKVRKAGRQKKEIPYYIQNWHILLDTHREMKDLQKDIRAFQGRVKQQGLDSATTGHYLSLAKTIWNKVNACWNSKGLKELGNWIEITSTDNFNYFNGTLQNLEERILPLDRIDMNNIKELNQEIKAFENDLKQKDDKGNPIRPMKYKIGKEMFARTWALKQHLQSAWNGNIAASSEEFDLIRQEVDRKVAELAGADTVDAMYTVRDSCKTLHNRRREGLQDGKLTARDNGRLNRLIQGLHDDAHDLIQVVKPPEFSYEWLLNAHNMNLKNGWVVFVDTVPSISS